MFDRKQLVLTVLAFSLLGTASCTKSEGTTSGAAANSGSSPAPSTPSASAAAAASAAPDASPLGADTTTGLSPAGGADATAPAASGESAAAPAASAGPVDCGKKPLPDCPLQGWMKTNTNPQVADKDFTALATNLDKAAAFAPPGYTNWASIAKDGAKAARDKDMTATKASCRTCHDQYKEKYKKELRARKI